jgi:OmpA-OmpF porin, OOP family
MRFLTTLFFILGALCTPAQAPGSAKIVKNLIPNGSFENSRKKSGDIRKAIPWQQIESVDFYMQPLDNDTTVDKGAFTGNHYGGVRFRKNYKEFLQVKLVEPLHRGRIYEYSMYLRLAYWSNATLKSFGAIFTKAGYRRPADAVKGSMIDTVSEYGLADGYRWFKIRGYYKADGGEKFLTVGNFAPVIKKEMVRIDISKFGAREAYYFIDDIRLFVAPQFEEKITVERVGPDYQSYWVDSTLAVKENISVGEKIALKNISFVDDKYYLLPESYSELNKLATYLSRNPTIEIQINGHSGDDGFEFKNQRVSELRAREVFEYLIRRGVQNKMTYKGFGSEQPVSEEDTPEGRAKNRRVEFEIIRK